jgi:hypothetical protein
MSKKKYTKEILILELQRYYNETGKIPTTTIFRKNKTFPHSKNYEYYFGTWNIALKEAGFLTNDERDLLSTINKSELYNSNPKFCEKCKNQLTYEHRENRFCSYKCANSRPPRNAERKKEVGLKIQKTMLSNNNSKITTIEEQNRINDIRNRKNRKKELTKLLELYKYPFTFLKQITCKKCKKLKYISHKATSYYCHKCRTETKPLYWLDCRFKISFQEFPELYDFNLFNKYGWYQPTSATNPNVTGVTWDHLYRIADGFKNNIPPEIIKHPANAEMVPFKENHKRSNKSTITLEELYNRISQWESEDRNLKRYYFE